MAAYGPKKKTGSRGEVLARRKGDSFVMIDEKEKF